MVSYEKAFALGDNPFRPLRSVKGVSKTGLMQGLESNPLRIDIENALLGLFCPFRRCQEHLQDFEQSIDSEGGYRLGQPGTQSFIFLIFGHQGTGKTTLAAVMLDRAKKCMADGTKWHPFAPEPRSLGATASDHIAALKTLETQIQQNTQAGDYCYILLENLAAGAEGRAFDLYDTLTQERLVFLFLLTSNQHMLSRNETNSRHQLKVYRTHPLASQDAAEFVKHRISFFRMPAPLVDLQAHPLFPFDENDVKEAVETGVLATNPSEGTPVTIRQFSVVLHRAITRALRSLPEGFDLTAVPCGKLDQYVIRLAKTYEKMVA